MGGTEEPIGWAGLRVEERRPGGGSARTVPLWPDLRLPCYWQTPAVGRAGRGGAGAAVSAGGETGHGSLRISTCRSSQEAWCVPDTLRVSLWGPCHLLGRSKG